MSVPSELEAQKNITEIRRAFKRSAPQTKCSLSEAVYYFETGNGRPAEKSIAEIIDDISPSGPDKVQRFESWVKKFES